MTDYEALLHAVLADPEDDLPRLVLADCLEETGQPANTARAVFIRAQIDSEALPLGSTQRAELEQYATELLERFGGAWNSTLPDWVTWRDTKVGYRRGFVEELSTTPRRLFRDGHELFAVAPVRRVRVRAPSTYTSDTTEMFRDQEYFARIAHLRLGPGLLGRAPLAPTGPLTRDHGDPLDIHLLTHSRRLTGLRTLDVSDNGLSDDWVTCFATRFPRAAFADSLAALDLSDNLITGGGASRLVRATELKQVHFLLSGNHIDIPTMQWLRDQYPDRVTV
jgi:uncharacterized protein (TIGR02996 family)